VLGELDRWEPSARRASEVLTAVDAVIDEPSEDDLDAPL